MHLAYITLPYPTVSPNERYFAHTQFYWDTYFTLLGLVVSGRAEQARQMVDNLTYLFDKFGLVPARNSWTSLGRSQPPYLTRMAFEVYEHGGADLAWLDKIISLARTEYEEVWLSGRRFDRETGLSRYQPQWWKRLLTVYESGWDSSARYTSKNFRSLIPVDLNCQLYQYESDFAKHAKLRKDDKSAAKWQKTMEHRKQLINSYFWDETRGFYFDYDKKTGSPARIRTLAGLYPLWCGAASREQAERAVLHISDFEYAGGLSNTERIAWRCRQWDYPNGWPPHQYIVYRALRHYGFDDDAKRLAQKWLDLNLTVFKRTGKMWEKYDVVNGHVGWRGRYPTQAGFAWTNGVFLRLLHEKQNPNKK